MNEHYKTIKQGCNLINVQVFGHKAFTQCLEIKFSFNRDKLKMSVLNKAVKQLNTEYRFIKVEIDNDKGFDFVNVLAYSVIKK